MAASASGNPQQQGLYEQHLANLAQPLGTLPQAPGTTMGSAPASAMLYQPYGNNWATGSGGAQIAKPDGTMVANPFNLTAEQIYWALSGHPDAIARLGQSLGGIGENVDPAAKQLFHQIVNYYEAGGGGFAGGDYTPEDAAKAQANYAQGMGQGYQPQTWLSGMPVYGSMADAAAGGVVGPGATAAGNGTNVAGYATGQGMNISPTAPSGGGAGGGTGGGTGTGGGAGTGPGAGTGGGQGTPTPGTTGGSDGLGNEGQSEFPIASAANYARPTYTPYTAPTRPAEINKPFDLFNDEGYQFRLKEGIDGIENSAAARGNLNSGRTLKDLTEFASGLASQEYGAAFGRYDTSRKFGEGQFQADRGFGRDVYTGDRGFDYNSILDERNFNNDNRKWDTSFNNANRIDARNFDYGVYTGDRDFNEGVRRWDTSFNYNAATGDRDFEYKTLSDLAKMGLLAVDASGNLSIKGAGMTSSNNATGAGAGAVGTVANANIANMTVSDFIKWLNSQNVANGG